MTRSASTIAKQRREAVIAAGLRGEAGADTTEWRAIPGFPGCEVSREGQVRSWRKGRGRFWWLITPQPDVNDYHRVTLADGKIMVHRAVLLAFVGPCPDGMEGAHNDGDRSNNRLENLRWATHVDNCADKRQHGTIPLGDRHPNAKHSDEDVLRVRAALGAGETQISVARNLGVSLDFVRRVSQGRRDLRSGTGAAPGAA
jgi:hypothetical protein